MVAVPSEPVRCQPPAIDGSWWPIEAGYAASLRRRHLRHVGGPSPTRRPPRSITTLWEQHLGSRLRQRPPVDPGNRGATPFHGRRDPTSPQRDHTGHHASGRVTHGRAKHPELLGPGGAGFRPAGGRRDLAVVVVFPIAPLGHQSQNGQLARIFPLLLGTSAQSGPTQESHR